MLIHFAIAGGMELYIVAGVIVLLFGAQRLPAMARSMGEGIKEFKKGVREATDDNDATPAPTEKRAE